jgi:DnaK suppressor protein
MVTKTKVTKESASKATKATAAAPAPEKKDVAKAKNTAVTSQEPTLVEAPKSAKTASKPKPQLLAVTPEPKQNIVPEPTDKPAKKTLPQVNDAAEQAAPQSSPVVIQDKKWLEIRMILEKLKEDALREIRKSVKNGTEAVAAIEPGGDIYDQASSERDRELGLLLGDREREKIHSIDEALLRIDEGEYGICEECDEDIPLGRLKAMPFTRHCVKCKSDLEKLQAQTKRVEEERAYREIPLGAEEEES